MSFEPFVLPVILVWAIASGISLLRITVGSLLYDVRAIKCQQELKRHPNTRALRQRPLVTVLINAKNDEQTIERCLASIFKGSYRNVEALIVDHASQDTTKQLIGGYKTKYPQHTIRLVARRASNDQAASLSRAYKTYGHGQFVIVLSAKDWPERSTTRSMVQNFALNPDVDILVPNIRVVPEYRITGLLHVYFNLLTAQAKKAVGSARLTASNAACFRAETFQTCYSRAYGRRTDTQVQVQYASDTIINVGKGQALTSMICQRPVIRAHYLRAFATRAKDSRKSVLQAFLFTMPICALITSLTSPLVATYLLYLALALHEPSWLLLGVAGMSAHLVYSIWDDSLLRPLQKAVYTFGIPISFMLILGLAFLQPVTSLGIFLPRRQ